MSWAAAVPSWLWWLVVLGVAVGGQQLRVAGLQADLSSERQAHSDYKKLVAEHDRLAAQVALAETKRRIDAARGVELDAEQKIEIARADADRAGDALQRLQQQFDAVSARSRACGNTVTAQLGQAADAPARMQADMFRRIGEAARLYARVADDRGIAGEACAAAYQSLN